MCSGSLIIFNVIVESCSILHCEAGSQAISCMGHLGKLVALPHAHIYIQISISNQLRSFNQFLFAS